MHLQARPLAPASAARKPFIQQTHPHSTRPIKPNPHARSAPPRKQTMAMTSLPGLPGLPAPTPTTSEDLPFRLFDLPQELQDSIFALAYQQPEIIRIISKHEWDQQEDERRRRNRSTYTPKPFPPPKVSEWLVSRRFLLAASAAWFASGDLLVDANQWGVHKTPQASRRHGERDLLKETCFDGPQACESGRNEPQVLELHIAIFAAYIDQRVCDMVQELHRKGFESAFACRRRCGSNLTNLALPSRHREWHWSRSSGVVMGRKSILWPVREKWIYPTCCACNPAIGARDALQRRDARFGSLDAASYFLYHQHNTSILSYQVDNSLAVSRSVDTPLVRAAWTA